MKKRNKLVIFISLLFLSSSAITIAPASISKKDQADLLERHNFYRKKLGIAPLQWSNELAELAENWAVQLAKKCELSHTTHQYGENLFWTSTTSTPKEVVDYWADEAQYFNHKKPIYKSGKGNKYGHYTQIIWAKTTEMGGAKATCKHGGEIWVCNYNPAGNEVGERAF